MVSLRIAGSDIKVAYDSDQIFFNHTSILFVPWYLLKGIRNRSIAKSAKYRDETQSPSGEYREDLEDLSCHFNPKYVLAIMNSSWAREFLRSRRRSNTDLYPDDWKPLPVPVVSQNVQEVIANKVDEILKALKKGQDVSKLENEVDTMISALYNTEKEQSRASLMAL